MNESRRMYSRDDLQPKKPLEEFFALESENSELAAIQAGIADMESGRYRFFSEFDAEFRNKFGIPSHPTDQVK